VSEVRGGGGGGGGDDQHADMCGHVKLRDPRDGGFGARQLRLDKRSNT